MRPSTAQLLLLGFLALTECSHEWWLRADSLPQGWDQAAQLTAAERFRQMSPGRSLLAFPVDPGYYPPLVPWLASLSGRIVGNTDDGFTRIMPVFRVLLIVSTYRLALTLVSPAGAISAAVLLGTAPLVVRDARSLTLDLPLAAMTALGVWLLAASGLRTRSAALRFGAVAGLGMLVKWTLPIFLLAPVIGAIRASRKHLVATAFVAGGVCVIWYAGSFSHLKRELSHAAYTGADIAADRMLSWFSVSFYPLGLPETIGWPMTLCAIIGLILAIQRPAWRQRMLVLLVPLLLLILIRNKKERYFAPAYPFLAVLAGLCLDRITQVRIRRRAVAGLGAVCMLQFASLTFPMPWTFGVSCRPQVQVWPVEAMVQRAVEGGGGSLAVIPDVQTLNLHMIEFQSLRLGGSVKPAGIAEFPGMFDWALVKTGGQGPWHSTPERRERITRELLSTSGAGALFTTVRRWPLPDGSTARLLRRRPAGSDPVVLPSALCRTWSERFSGPWTVEASSAGGTTFDVMVNGRNISLNLDADGVIVPLTFSRLNLRFVGATPYVQPDGSTVLRCGRVVVASASLTSADVTMFLRTARMHWKNGDLRLVSKPVRSFLRRLEDPGVTIVDGMIVLSGRMFGRPLRVAVELASSSRGFTWRVAGIRGAMLATEYPLAARLAADSLRVTDSLIHIADHAPGD